MEKKFKAADDGKRKLAMEGKITAMQRKYHDLMLLRGKRRDYIIAKALKQLLREGVVHIPKPKMQAAETCEKEDDKS